VAYAGFYSAGKSVTSEQLKTFTTMKDYLSAVSNLELGINPGFLVGHGTIRLAVMGMENRAPTAYELDQMKDMLAENLEQGAFGLSTGLVYPPGVFADDDELVALCEVLYKYDAIHCTHLRNESFKLTEAVEEAINLGRRTGCKTQISHHQVAAREKWGEVWHTLDLIELANHDGIRVSADVYPYTVTGTTLAAMIPPAFLDGGILKMVERLKQADIRQQISEILSSDDISWENIAKEASFENIMIIDAHETPEVVGKTLSEIAESTGATESDTLFDILIANEGNATMVEFCLDEHDVELILHHPRVMIASDSTVDYPGMNFHPRTGGSFPRVLGRYTRERGLLTLEEAIRKMTSLSADTFGLANKGRIMEGYDADLVIFNPETIIDKADYLDARQPPEGIESVILNGQIAVQNNQHLNNAKGTIQKRSS